MTKLNKNVSKHVQLGLFLTNLLRNANSVFIKIANATFHVKDNTIITTSIVKNAIRNAIDVAAQI